MSIYIPYIYHLTTNQGSNAAHDRPSQVPFAKSQRPVAKVEGRIQIAIAIAQMQTLVIFHVTWEEGEFQGKSAIRWIKTSCTKTLFVGSW